MASRRGTRGAIAVIALALGLGASDGQAQPAAPSASAAAGPAGGLHIHVRGTSELQAVASSDPEGFSVRGDLIDDAGTPIPHGVITVQAFAPDDPRTPLKLLSLEPCDPPAKRFGRPGAGDGELFTDERGGFCVTGKSPVPKFVLKVRYAGGKLHDPFDMSLPVEAEQDHLLRTLLRFEPPPELVDLDHEAVTITASLRTDRSEQSRPNAAPSARKEGMVLTLEDEHGQRLGEATTGGDGRARFDVKTAGFPGPGPGEIVARFGGKPGIAKAVVSQPVIRRADVHLALSHPLERADADEGFPIDVDVTTTRGAVSGGVVEVVRALPVAAGKSGGAPVLGETVGAGEVTSGHAHVVIAFASGGAATVPLTLRYVPAAPWYRAGPALEAEVKLAGPGILKQLILALVVIGAAAWVVGGWRRAPKAVAPGIDPAIPGPPSGRAGVEVLAAAGAGGGWRGVVSDAHEGTPIAGAKLSIVAPSFEGDGVVASVTTDERGAFTLAGAHRSDARLVVESRLHSAHEQPLPPPSVLGVALVTRRRAVLDRLVRWARRQGAPFDGTPEPTPGHVRRVASRGGAVDVEAWARRVESAAYGPELADETIEREVRSAEPRAAR